MRSFLPRELNVMLYKKSVVVNFTCRDHATCPTISDEPQATNRLPINGLIALSNPADTQRESLGSCPKPTSIRGQLPGFSTQSDLESFPEASVNGAKTTSEATLPSDTKTLQSLLFLLQLKLGDTTLVIHGFDQSVGSSRRSKRYNALSMRAVMDSSRYLCMTILVIKQQSLCDYEKIVTYKSCNYGDLMYLHHQRQP